MTATAENIRFHAAGHLAAAHSLAKAGHVEAARHVLRIVRQYMESPRVESPPALRASIDAAIIDPVGTADEIAAVEGLFCHPANTALEGAGIHLGRGE